MQNPSISVRLTYRDILALPDDLLRHELIDGEHIVSPAPVIRHQRILRNLTVCLAIHLAAHPQGEVLFAPVDVLFSEHDMVEPDLVYISDERGRRQLNEKRLVGPPDLAVEVLSPSTRKIDETRKLRLYERFGVSEYWLVDPEQETVRIHRQVKDRLVLATMLSRQVGTIEQNLSTPLLPGLAIPLAAIFE
jgi:Uma2 family endonuclease